VEALDGVIFCGMDALYGQEAFCGAETLCGGEAFSWTSEDAPVGDTAGEGCAVLPFK
jgi:hypothetical protein